MCYAAGSIPSINRQSLYIIVDSGSLHLLPHKAERMCQTKLIYVKEFAQKIIHSSSLIVPRKNHLQLPQAWNFWHVSQCQLGHCSQMAHWWSLDFKTIKICWDVRVKTQGWCIRPWQKFAIGVGGRVRWRWGRGCTRSQTNVLLCWHSCVKTVCCENEIEKEEWDGFWTLCRLSTYKCWLAPHVQQTGTRHTRFTTIRLPMWLGLFVNIFFIHISLILHINVIKI